MTGHRIRVSARLCAAAAMLTCLLAAPPDSLARRHKPAAPPQATPAVAGMVAAVDPQTGRLTFPSREQLLELSAMEQHMISRSDVGLVQHRLANGAVVLDLDGRFQEFTVLQLGPGGHRTFSCVSDPAAVARSLKPADSGRDARGLEVR